MSGFELSCEGFVIRPYQEGDEESLARHANDRSVWRNLTDKFPHPYRREDAAQWIGAQRELAGEAPPHNLAISVDAAVCGGIGFEPYTDLARRGAEIGYWLGRAFWGRGIATRALVRMTQHIFSSTDIVRLQATVLEWNPASGRVLEKAGYQLECRLRKSISKDGELIDSFLYARVKQGV